MTDDMIARGVGAAHDPTVVSVDNVSELEDALKAARAAALAAEPENEILAHRRAVATAQEHLAGAKAGLAAAIARQKGNV